MAQARGERDALQPAVLGLFRAPAAEGGARAAAAVGRAGAAKSPPTPLPRSQTTRSGLPTAVHRESTTRSSSLRWECED